jgi:hypothetical protein
MRVPFASLEDDAALDSDLVDYDYPSRGRTHDVCSDSHCVMLRYCTIMLMLLAKRVKIDPSSASVLICNLKCHAIANCEPPH